MRPTVQLLLAALFSLLSVVALTSAAPTVAQSEPGASDVRADGEDIPLSRRSPSLPENVEMELEVRNPAVMFIVRQAVTVIVGEIVDQIKEDKLARENFTRQFINVAREQHPEFNWLIIHVEHSTDFDGVEGEDWGHTHVELDIAIGGTIGYEVYWFGPGTVLKPGDGGYINWAYGGEGKRTSAEHNEVIFTAPPGYEGAIRPANLSETLPASSAPAPPHGFYLASLFVLGTIGLHAFL